MVVLKLLKIIYILSVKKIMYNIEKKIEFFFSLSNILPIDIQSKNPKLLYPNSKKIL